MKKAAFYIFVLLYGTLSQGMKNPLTFEGSDHWPRIHLNGAQEENQSVKGAIITGRTNPGMWSKLLFFPNLERLSLAETIQEVSYGFTRQEELNHILDILPELSRLRILNLCNWPVEQSHLGRIPEPVIFLEFSALRGGKYNFSLLEARGVTVVAHGGQRLPLKRIAQGKGVPATRSRKQEPPKRTELSSPPPSGVSKK
jgi:hypothetical protein